MGTSVLEGAPSLVEAVGIHKAFGGAVAVEDVSLAVAAGEIHAVVGENGAGKSTLMRVLAGILTPDAGTVTLDGQTVEPNAKAALEAGISLVHQELSLVPEMTVAENILLGAMPTIAGFTRSRALRARAQAALDLIGIQVDLQERISKLSVAMRQFVEIARAVAREPRVLILDEPTATLTPTETDYLLAMLRELATRGMAIIYISHRIPEVFWICDSVTVLRDARTVTVERVQDTTPAQVVAAMVGRELQTDERRESGREFGPIVLAAEGIKAPGVYGADVTVRGGEIVGIGGLVGAGRTEFVRAIIGADPRAAGTATLTVDGVSKAITSYEAAVRDGVGYVPEERRSEGLSLTMTVEDNIALPNRGSVSTGGVLKPGAVRALADRLARVVGLRPPEVWRDAGEYSGGNQQKIVIAKWLGREPALIVLDEPTRGVDVGAKAEIYRLIRELADAGTGVLMVSSDLPELLLLSDTIHVVRDGVIVGSIDGDEATEKTVMSLAAGEEKVGIA